MCGLHLAPKKKGTLFMPNLKVRDLRFFLHATYAFFLWISFILANCLMDL